MGRRKWSATVIRVTSFPALCLVLALLEAPVAADLGPSGLDASDPIFVPIRWCALEGSPVAVDPGQVGEPDTDSALWRRHERATDNFWSPGALISFRSAFTSAVAQQSNFPIIPDPSPSPGMAGDVRNPDQDETEYNDARAACMARWDAIEMMFPGVNLEGPVVINVRRLVNQDGSQAQISGQGGYQYTWPGGPDPVCTNPSALTQVTSKAIITDYLFLRDFDPVEELLAHEFGHVLGLQHGNGQDDNNNGMFDGYGGQTTQTECDASENPSAPPPSLMTPNIGVSTPTITNLQRNRARAIAMRISGVSFDPPQTLVRGPVLSDSRVDKVKDVDVPAIDIVASGMATNDAEEVTSFTHELLRIIPSSGTSRYSLFLNLDGDNGTGGKPDQLGFDTGASGVEVVTSVGVSHKDATRVVTGRIWRWQQDSFEALSEEELSPRVQTVREVETGSPLYDVVSVDVRELIGPAPGTQGVRMQATAEVLEDGVAASDRLPEGHDEVLSLYLTEPRYPLATVDPARVAAGKNVVVEASGLVPNGTAKILLGDALIDTAETDREGNVRAEVSIPKDAKLGPRLVTVGVQKTALSADAILDVREDEDGSPWYWWLGVLLAIILGIILFLLIRRRRTT
jgi:hypothetical protein